MDNTGRLAAAVASNARRQAGAANSRKPIFYAKWVAAESVDANLSQIYVAGAGFDASDEIFRFVPKLAHVTGLSTSSTVLCLGSPLCIIGVVVGDITLAEV